MSEKYFTLAEANKLIPILEKELVELQQLKTKFQVKDKELKLSKKDQAIEFQTNSEWIFMKESELEFMEIQAQLHLSNIHSFGVQLKNIELGLLDFPANVNGEEVLLCWKQGESEITHYHGMFEGFSGRRKL